MTNVYVPCASRRWIHISFQFEYILFELAPAQTRFFESSTFKLIAGFLYFEMEQQPMQADSVQQQPMEVENASAETVIAKKQVSNVDTRVAIKPFKTCRDRLEAFVQACNRKKTGGSTPEMFGVFFKRIVMTRTWIPLKLITSPSSLTTTLCWNASKRVQWVHLNLSP